MPKEYALKECVFHFNKKHLEDSTIPMWVLKFKGKTTLYVNHVTANVKWSTKETSDNPHTKGSLKFHNVLLSIDDENHATLSELTRHDAIRIKHQKENITRIIIFSMNTEIRDYLKIQKIKHSPIKKIKGTCDRVFDICDIKKSEDVTLLKLTYSDNFRILQPNELYFKAYDDSQLLYQINYDDEKDDEDEDINF